MGLWAGLYEFWTGFDLEHPLHSHAMRGNLASVQALVPKIISKEIDIDSYNDFGSIALIYCFMSAENIEKLHRRYEIAILFLELGAKPYLPSKKQKNTTIHYNIDERNIGAHRLLLWYDPDYENIPDNKNILSAAQKLNQKGLEEFKKITEETAKDARAVKKLFAEAEALKEKHDFITAIEHYKKAAGFFKKHMLIEEKLPYQPEFEESRPVLVNFYKKKIFQCHQKVDECYSKLLHTEEITKSHLEILQYLANQATAFNLREQAIGYAKKLAELSVFVKLTPARQSQFSTDPNKNTKMQAEGNRTQAKEQHEEENEYTPLLDFSRRKSLTKIDASNPNSNPQLRKRLIDHTFS